MLGTALDFFHINCIVASRTPTRIPSRELAGQS